MRLFYVAGPFSAPTRAGVEVNIKRASELGIEIARIGGFPVIPHANTAHPLFEKVQPYQFWIDATMAMLRVCHAVALVERWEQSSGARGEEAEARRTGMPVFYPGTGQLIAIRDWLGQQQARATAETLRPAADPFSNEMLEPVGRQAMETLPERCMQEDIEGSRCLKLHGHSGEHDNGSEQWGKETLVERDRAQNREIGRLVGKDRGETDDTTARNGGG